MDNIISLLALIVGAISAVGVFISSIIGVVHYRKKILLKRSEYFSQMLDKLRSDEEMRSIFQQIDNRKFKYKKSFHNSKAELLLDKLLYYHSYLCYLKLFDIITEDEFLTFKYEVVRTMKDPNVQSYLYNIYYFSQEYPKKIEDKEDVPKEEKTDKIAVFPFYYLLQYGKTEGIIENEFFNKDSLKYPHYL